MALTLWGTGYDDASCGQLAAQLQDSLKEVPDISEVTVIGGRPRQVTVELDPAALGGARPGPAGRAAGARACERARGRLPTWWPANRATRLEAGGWPESVADLTPWSWARLAVPVRLGDVATVADEAGEPDRVRVLPPEAGADVPGGHALDRQAQGHQRHRAHQRRRAQARDAARLPAAGRPAGDRHARLRRDRRAQVERAAVAHVPRRHLGVASSSGSRSAAASRWSC